MRLQSKIHELNKHASLLYNKAAFSKLNILKNDNKIFHLKLCLPFPILLRFNRHTMTHIYLKCTISSDLYISMKLLLQSR